jgi:hypothetical protein
MGVDGAAWRFAATAQNRRLIEAGSRHRNDEGGAGDHALIAHRFMW